MFFFLIYLAMMQCRKQLQTVICLKVLAPPRNTFTKILSLEYILNSFLKTTVIRIHTKGLYVYVLDKNLNVNC